MSDASTEKPAQFEAVGGHVSSIVYGETTRDGRTTLRKPTTAWEILYYLAIELCKNHDKEHLHTADAPETATEDSVFRTQFLRAAGQLGAFTPELFSIQFSALFTPGSDELRQLLPNHKEWVVLERGSPKRARLMKLLFDQLFCEMEKLEEFHDHYDNPHWGIGLVNETYGMQQPCVMDVKVGFIRHAPATPADKLERMMKKERHSLMRTTAVRICGTRRYIHPPTTAEATEQTTTATKAENLVCEQLDKRIGFASKSEDAQSACLKRFFTVGEPLAHVSTADTTLHLPPDSMEGVSDLEEERMEKRLAQVRPTVASFLRFFEETPDGAFLIHNMAFVSTSLLFLYDAAAAPDVAPARVRLIDLARSGWRRCNFDEPTIGFLQGLKNLVAYLS